MIAAAGVAAGAFGTARALTARSLPAPAMQVAERDAAADRADAADRQARLADLHDRVAHMRTRVDDLHAA
ncbi:MAG: hypothetical protein KC464_00585, partial [Myxococcales bacterium]|nr:hypothetical protein [Myxococcales bacterium]